MEEAKKRGAKWMHPEYKTKPRIYYLGLPSVSLAGHLIDARRLMDVTGADVTITGTKTGSTISLRTNVSGNFLAENLDKDSAYTVKIEHQGYLPKTINDVRIDIEYKHLGDIKLDKVS